MWYEITSPMTASLKGYTEPKMHIGKNGITFCGKNWRDAGWGHIEDRETPPEQDGHYCSRCIMASFN